MGAPVPHANNEAERSGNAWAKRHAFSMKPGKYNLSELADADELNDAKGKELAPAAQVASKLPQRVVSLMELIFDEQVSDGSGW